MDSIGFIGIGTIATATVQGLRAGWPDLRIHLSPRSDAASRALAAAHPGAVERGASNAAVVEASGIVVLTMLPTQLDEAVRGLPFRPDQIVVSCVAGTPLAEVAALVAPAQCCRLVPLPMIARREGPILLHPALPAVQRLFAPLGDLILPHDEAAFAALAAGSAVMSTFFALEGAVADWMAAQGAETGAASTYVRSLFRALGETGLRTDPADAPTLVAGHETPGGLNQRVRRSLAAQGWFAAPGAAFESLIRLRRSDLGNEEDA